MEKEKNPKRVAAGRLGGNALVAKYGTEHMRAIGKSGYFATGAKYGWQYTNEMLFGAHLPAGRAKRELNTNGEATQLRFYLGHTNGAQKDAFGHTNEAKNGKNETIRKNTN